MKRKTIYYKDEINDDFSGVERDTITIDGKYKYVHKKNWLWKFCSTILYFVIMKPLVYLYMKLKYVHKIKNRKVLKDYQNQGCFLFCNHALMDGDAFIPNIVDFKKRTYIVVHPDNLSVSITKGFLEMNGALPLPATVEAAKNFIGAMETFLKMGNNITIFPEAHVWPYYTGIRPFANTSFKYPIMFNAPVFVLTNTFHRRKFFKLPQVVTYVDGPFLPDETLLPREQSEDLRNKVYDCMCERSKLGNYQYIRYIKEDKCD